MKMFRCAVLIAWMGTVCHAQDAAPRKEISLPAATLASYVGTYELAPRINMMITLAGSQLSAQLSGQGKLPIFPQSETLFFLKAVDAQIEFGKDDTGAYLTLHQGGRDQKAIKKTNMVLERKEVAVPRKLLAEYAGTYELRPGFDLAVTLEGDQLITQATGQPKFPIYGESDTRFFPKAFDAELEFARNDKGAVDRVILHQGGNDLTGKRK